MFEQSPSDKVRFLGLGDLPSPGSCFICGSGTREEGYVDCGLWLEFIGEALICHTCVIQIGEVIGMMIPEEVKVIHDTAAGLASENAKIKLELEAANERLAHYDSIFSAAFPSASINPSVLDGPGQPTLDSATEGSGDRESAPEESGIDDGGLIGFGAFEQNDPSGATDDEPLLKL
jgi:hypothetical protein